MVPYSEINIGDMFSNPLFRNYGRMSGLEYVVVDKKENLILVQAVSKDGKEVQTPFWKQYTDRMFSNQWKLSI